MVTKNDELEFLAQVAFHCGYDYDAYDMHDVRLLCERFGIPLPEAYRNKTD